MKNKVNAFTFLAILAAISLGFFFGPKKAYSDNENRYLAQMPMFSFEKLFEGSFTSGFEDYVTDGFIARDGWISLKSRLDLLSGRKDTGGVYIAKDGSIIEMFSEIDMGRWSRNIGYLKAAKEGFQTAKRVDIMLVPTAAEVWHDKIAENTPDIDQKALLEEAGVTTVDCLGVLEAHRDEAIYYKTDHHWTSLGAYYCYQALMGDQALPLEAFDHRVLSEDFLGTTFSKAGIYSQKDTIDGYTYGRVTVEDNFSGKEREGLYEESYLSKKDKYSVFLGGNQPISVIRTDSEGGKLLLVKDSYANTIVQFLTPHYSEIHVVDPRSFGMSIQAYAQEQEIDDVLILYNIKGFSEESTIYRIAQ